MPKKRSWTNEQLITAVHNSNSYRSVLLKIGLVPAGGNYQHVTRIMRELELSTDHFTGKGWNINWQFDPRKPNTPLSVWLTIDSSVQSNTLKKRLFKEGIKKPLCELCGWKETSVDGRIPVELDHINGEHTDNRLENLRILCPNCHSLQTTHRGKNKKVRLKYNS